MPETIDARGLTCPAPSDLAFQAMFGRRVPEVRVLVDDPASRDHLKTLADRLGYRIAVMRGADYDTIDLVKRT